MKPLICFLLCQTFFSPAQAVAGITGENLSIFWGIPFVGILLSLALIPVFASQFWHKHYGKITAFWAFLILSSLGYHFGMHATLEKVSHVLLSEYIPFIIMAGTLFTIAGGIQVFIGVPGTPIYNLLFMTVGTFIASWIGTTGSAMLLIRPFIQMNAFRKQCAHSIIFFIFLVCNVGGALTALGDPPLFLGYLMGVHFFWSTTHLFLPYLSMVLPLLFLYFVIDLFYYRREAVACSLQDSKPCPPTKYPLIQMKGVGNLLLFAVVIFSVLLSGWWKSQISWTFFGTKVALEDLVRNGVLCAMALISYFCVNRKGRVDNQFSWEPLTEIVKLFAGIFITAAPVIAMLKAKEKGVFAHLLDLTVDAHGHPIADLYYWLSGGLSAFLDNAPTYLVFFHMAGGNAQHLMTSPILIAISCGAVFMGALTYIGNAPNFMVRAIAEDQGIKMPSFFGYLVWSIVLFFPWLYFVSLVFF